MGMFDWYEPVPALHCPSCGGGLSDWQGQEAENALLVWRQGEPHPVEHRVDEDSRFSDEELRQCRLPCRFSFGTQCPSDGKWISAEGLCEEGIWMTTTPQG